MRILHAADLHLDSPLVGLEAYEGAPLAELRGATRRALENLVSLAVSEEVALVLIAGDVFDGAWRDYNTGLFFAARLAELREAGIPVVMISGNHDAESVIARRLTLPDGVTLLPASEPGTVVLEELGVAVHGQGFRDRAVSEDLSRAYPAPLPGLLNVGLLHTSADGRPGHDSYAPCSVERLAAHGYDYWALGHVHAREVLAEDPWIVFPGNVQGRHARETGRKGATLIEVAGERIAGVEHRDLDVLRWASVAVDAGGCDGLDDVLARVAAGLDRAVAEADGRLTAVRVRIAGACRAHAELARDAEHLAGELRALRMGRAWIEKVELRTSAAVAAEELRAREDALGELLRDVALADPAALAAEFADLRAKLPPELREGVGDPGRIAELLPEAEQLLVARLLEAA